MTVTTELAAAFHITFDAPITRFAIDDAAFEAWTAQIDPDDAADLLPSRGSESPSSDLYRLLTEAEEHDVITSDPRLELEFYGDEDLDGSGFWVSVANRAGEQRFTSLSAGWSELDFPAEEASFADAAREQLEHIIGQANSVLPNR